MFLGGRETAHCERMGYSEVYLEPSRTLELIWKNSIVHGFQSKVTDWRNLYLKYI